jgi:hypothetical protein
VTISTTALPKCNKKKKIWHSTDAVMMAPNKFDIPSASCRQIHQKCQNRSHQKRSDNAGGEDGQSQRRDLRLLGRWRGFLTVRDEEVGAVSEVSHVNIFASELVET